MPTFDTRLIARLSVAAVALVLVFNARCVNAAPILDSTQKAALERSQQPAWKNSPDYKAGRMSKRVVQYFNDVQKFYDDSLKTNDDLARVNIFNLSDFGKGLTNSQQDVLHIKVIGLFVAGALWENQQTPKPKEFFSLSKNEVNGTCRELMLEFAKGLVRKELKDTQMQLTYAMALETLVRITTRLQKGYYKVEDIDACTLHSKPSNKAAVYEEIRVKAVGNTAAWRWFGDDYTKEKCVQMATATLRNINAIGIDKYITYLMSTKGENSRLRASIFAQVQKEDEAKRASSVHK